MIVLTCTNCRARLEMDDAFAGGVCRCMYCGTIQTVPSHLRRAGAATSVKVIHQTQPRPARDAAGNGSREADASGELDQLADVVAATSGSSSGSGLAGSGLTGSGLRANAQQPARVRVATFAPPMPWWKRHRALLIGLAGAVCMVAAVAVLLVIFADDQASQQTSEASSSPRATATQRQAPPSQPNFCGLPLQDDRVVVYVLDRGGATGEMFATLKEATYRSVESLGPQRKFQIVFWNNGTTDQAYPASTPAPATSQNLDEARRAFDEVVAIGQSEPAAALGKAFAAKPDAVILVTAKPYELDDAFVRTIEELRRGSRARVSIVALGAGDASTALKKLAKSTGGEFRALTADALRAHAQ
jgi:hypothetical protein